MTLAKKKKKELIFVVVATTNYIKSVMNAMLS